MLWICLEKLVIANYSSQFGVKMIIDNLKSPALLSSSESLENIQQNLQAGELDMSDFSAALMDKINQLQGVDGDNFLLQDVKLSDLGEDTHLQNIAGLFGGFLPIAQTAKDTVDLGLTKIDSQVSLQEIMSESIDQKEMTMSELEDKLTTLIEELENIKTDIPEGDGFRERISQLDNMVEEIQQSLEKVQGQDESTLSLVDNIELDLERDEGSNNKHFKSDAGLENIETEDKAELGDKLNHLALEIQTVAEDISRNFPFHKEQKKETEVLKISEEESLPIQGTNQPITLVESESNPDKMEAVVRSASVQNLNPKYNKESLSVKQKIDNVGGNIVDSKELPLEGGLSKEDVERKILQENPFQLSQQGKESLASVSQKFEPMGMVSPEAIDLSADKSLSKFATEIAMLNKVVVTESKVDIPPMTKPFSHPEWNKEMGERIVWMHKQAIPSAELRLNPEHLGPIKIKIDLSQDQATIAFTAQHAVVKEAIEASIPKLREMFSAQQLNLADVNVSQNDSGQKQSKEFTQMGNGEGNGKKSQQADSVEQADNPIDIIDEIESGRAIASNGVLSIFA